MTCRSAAGPTRYTHYLFGGGLKPVAFKYADVEQRGGAECDLRHTIPNPQDIGWHGNIAALMPCESDLLLIGRIYDAN